MRIKVRSQKGNILALIAMITCCVLVPIFLLQSQIGLYIVDKNRVETVVEGACLKAANDISKIIIDDSHFGYVSLSNYPPVGKGTLAPDGEPLPVVGINTLVGTIRQNTIVANKLENPTMKSLVEKDRLYLNTTIKNLNFAIRDSLKKKKRRKWKDIHGQLIDPDKSATEFLSKYLPENMKLKSVKLTCGWLTKGGGTSTIACPKPERLANVKPEALIGDEYKPFINIPAFGKNFTFAGLGKSTRIVESKRFKRQDKYHICSIVKLECQIERKSAFKGGLDLNKSLKLKACCQPYSMPDSGPKGAMTFRFTGTPVSGLTTWGDFLDEHTFSDNKVTTYKSVYGDYPVDPKARMIKCRNNTYTNTARQLSEHLYCWFRSGHLRPNIDSILAMKGEFIKLKPNEMRIYEFAKDGSISRRTLPKYPFPVGLTADRQVSVTAVTKVQGGVSPIIIMKNNVRYLGTKYGGKHCGQPIPGLILNWCELSEYGGDEFIAKNLGKGRLTNNFSVITSPLQSTNISFNLFNGRPLLNQPRRTFYSGGLALDIEVGGTSFPNTKRDIVSMRKLPR